MHFSSLARFLFLPIAIAAALFVFGPLTGIPARPALAITNCNVSDLTIDSQEQAFLSLINNYRAQSGAGPLTISINLNRSASWMAVDLASKDYFSHTDSLGRSPSQRATDCGFPGGAGENLAAGTVTDTAQEAFDLWKNSPGHNQNMLNAAYKQIGIARYYYSASTYKWYWVTDFSLISDGTNALSGSGSSGGSSPTPTPTATVYAKASMTSPAAGSTLAATQTFQWSAGSGAQEYFLYVGTSQGSNNLFGQSMGLNRSITLAGFPRDGKTVYIRLWTRLPAGWQYTDYSYRDPS